MNMNIQPVTEESYESEEEELDFVKLMMMENQSVHAKFVMLPSCVNTAYRN